jgi:hypothetical protein
MQVTCSCGKKIFFGEDPNEVQVCDRCGQTVSTTGPVEDKPSRGKRGSGPRGGGGGGGGGSGNDDEPPPLRRPKGRPPITTREQLYIASAQKSWRGLGCLVFLLIVVGATVATDYFLVYPVRELSCGHEGKEAYLFGALPFGHSCPGFEAIRYMDSARKALRRTPAMLYNMDSIRKHSDIGEPPASYVFDVYEDGSFTADAEEGSGLASYSMDFDGSVKRETSE